MQHDVSSVLGHLCASLTHCHAHLRLLQGWCIIHTISRHGHDVTNAIVAVLLISLDNDLLVDGRDTGEDSCMLHCLRPPLHILFWLIVCEVVSARYSSIKHDTSDHRELCSTLQLLALICTFVPARAKNVDSTSNSSGSVLMITGHHDNLDTCPLRHNHGIVNTLLGRILDTVKADKFKVLHWEVAIRRGRALELVACWDVRA
mmetsp:Transcript_89989/g.160183  ORF Transcript_89989/g.160183 Transcript_89989/m.160183 type:complete len:203 (-) Transcript_89989:2000-2608(-)